MENDVGILDILDGFLHSERTFYQTVRILRENRREDIFETHQRNTAVLLGLIRSFMAIESPLYSVRYNVTIPPTLPTGWNDPVIIHPTPQQISAATEATSPDDDAGNCAICQESLTGTVTRIRHCGHSFHPTCISEWFTRSVHCPNCRHDIRDLDDSDEIPSPPLRRPGLIRRRGVILTTDPPRPTSSAQVHTPPLGSSRSALLSEVVNESPHTVERASSDEHHA
jgi:hypothetical protein